jgi:hypothetical protein
MALFERDVPVPSQLVRFALTIGCALACSAPPLCQRVITTFAGPDPTPPEIGVYAISASLGRILDVASAPDARIYLADADQRGLAYARPIAVDVAAAQSVVYRVSGTQAFAPGPTGVIADAGSPVTQGERLLVYCAGLGAVQPSGSAGVAAPGAVAASVPLWVGANAAEIKSAALSADKVGVYEIEAVVPGGVSPGSQAPTRCRSMVRLVRRQLSPCAEARWNMAKRP